jgi:Ca-activated chloride channel family protein
MKADFVLDYDILMAARAQNLYVLARIEAEPAPESDKRAPLNLSLVLDRSGSMGGDKIAYVKKAAQYLVQRLGASDRLSVVSYDYEVTVNVPSEPVIYKDRIIQAIQSLKPGNTTNLSGGWLQGCQQVDGCKAEGQINRVLLLTDGLANEGVTDPARLEAMARQKREEGITTTTMGVGMDFNEDLLTRMAAEGGGAFYFIDSPDQAPRIFAEELKDLLNVVGQNLVITLTLSPEIRMVRQLNTYPTDSHNGVVRFRLGDLFADELKLLLLELSIPALQHLGQVEVAKLRFEYDDLGGDTVSHRVVDLPIMVNTVPEADFAGRQPNEEVVKMRLLLEAARAREEAVKQADAGNFQAASQVLQNAAQQMRNSGLDDSELAQQQNMLYEEASDMDFGAERYDSRSRKTHFTKSMNSQRMSRSQDSVILHNRQKQSRDALERNGPPPTVLEWRDHSLDLTAINKLSIGSANDNDIVITGNEVKEHHCEIVRQGQDLYLHARDGLTFANGGQVHQPFRLSVRDVVSLDQWLFLFPR